MGWFGTLFVALAIGFIAFRVIAAIRQMKDHATAVRAVKAWKPPNGASVWQGERFLVLINPFG